MPSRCRSACGAALRILADQHPEAASVEIYRDDDSDTSGYRIGDLSDDDGNILPVNLHAEDRGMFARPMEQRTPTPNELFLLTSSESYPEGFEHDWDDWGNGTVTLR